jgi:hypothetical protein
MTRESESSELLLDLVASSDSPLICIVKEGGAFELFSFEESGVGLPGLELRRFLDASVSESEDISFSLQMAVSLDGITSLASPLPCN